MPQPTARTFLIRRLIVLGLLIAIIWGVVAGVGALFGAIGSWFAPATTITAGAPCAPGTVGVTAIVGDASGEKLSFEGSERPQVWFRITNNGTVACKFNAGPRVQFFKITSGDELIWNSKDCPRAGLGDLEVTLKPGESKESGKNEWYRVHSSSSGCGDGQVPAEAGAYKLYAEVNGVLSDNLEQFLLN
ncbi:MAG: hypothetical protein RLZ71_647 [Actinomycetota bacterium]|jgi:hypothetical protein